MIAVTFRVLSQSGHERSHVSCTVSERTLAQSRFVYCVRADISAVTFRVLCQSGHERSHVSCTVSERT
jgi:hypothetical protein